MAYKNLILFAGGAPFRDLHTFLKTEIEYLSKRFENIHVLVNSNEAPAIDLPANVHLDGLTVELSNAEKWLSLRKIFSHELKQELQFYSTQKQINLQAYKSIFNHYTSAEKFTEKLLDFLGRQQIKLSDNSTLFYSYWTDYRTVSLALLKEKHPEIQFIARMHGWDLYRERHRENYLPFRKLVYREADKIYFISEDGKTYFEKILGQKAEKASVNYLGTKDFGLNPQRSRDKLKLVSCSFSVALKRVELIAYTLKDMDHIEIEWTHIGSGPSQGYFESEIRDALKEKGNISYQSLGLISNEKVIQLYRNEHYDLFINTSEFEGIPIGMMEAMSFGIPCLGTDTGGVREIIENEKNGFLVGQYPEPKEIAEWIIGFFQLSEKEQKEFRENARKTWQEKFNAEKNYAAFMDDIFTLGH